MNYENIKTEHIFPSFFYSMGKSKSDYHFIASNMAKFERRIRIEACERYSSTYVSHGREKANDELLRGVFNSVKNGTAIEPKRTPEKPELSKSIKDRIERIKNLKKTQAKSKYGEIFKK